MAIEKKSLKNKLIQLNGFKNPNILVIGSFRLFFKKSKFIAPLILKKNLKKYYGRVIENTFFKNKSVLRSINK